MTRCSLCWFAILLIFKTNSVSAANFWHITDLHLDFYYSQNAKDLTKVCPSSFSGPALDPGFWGDYRCDSNMKLINSSINAMKSIQPEPDFILWTRDDTLHTSDEDRFLGVDLVLQTVANITRLIREAFPSTQVFAALGNHDYHPKDQMPPFPNIIVTEIADMWRDWMSDEQFVSFKNNGYGADNAKLAPQMRVLILNTNLWDDFNRHINGSGDPGGQLEWLESELQLSKRMGNKVFIIGHIAPGFFELVDNEYYLHPEYNAQYIELIQRYEDVITGQFFGHHHTDSFKLFYDKNKNPISSIFHAPSVTPRIGSRDGSVNPGIRLFEYDSDSAQVLDYVQYYYDLKMANEDQNMKWQIEYRATTAYVISDVSPTSLHHLSEKFREADWACEIAANYCEQNLLQKYSLYNSVSHQKKTCDVTCQRNHVCTIQEVDISSHQSCIDAWNRGNFIQYEVYRIRYYIGNYTHISRRMMVIIIFETVFGLLCIASGIAELIIYPGATFFQGIWCGAGAIAAGMMGIFAAGKGSTQSIVNVHIALGVIATGLAVALFVLSLLQTVFVYTLIIAVLTMLICLSSVIYASCRPRGRFEAFCYSLTDKKQRPGN